jgi:Domain of unknown function (DUF4936)
MRELFVYYRVHAAAAAEVRQAVLAMQRELRTAHPGLVARLLTRPRADGGATWMETYAFDAKRGSTHGIDAQIENEIAHRAKALSSFIDGPRHHELFDSDAVP